MIDRSNALARALTLAILAAPVAAQTTICVDASGGTPAGCTGTVFTDIGLAILSASPGDTIDVYPDEPNAKFDESLWHRFGLVNGRHTLRLVVRGEAYPGSSGANIAIAGLLVFE